MRQDSTNPLENGSSGNSGFSEFASDDVTASSLPPAASASFWLSVSGAGTCIAAGGESVWLELIGRGIVAPQMGEIESNHSSSLEMNLKKIFNDRREKNNHVMILIERNSLTAVRER